MYSKTSKHSNAASSFCSSGCKKMVLAATLALFTMHPVIADELSYPITPTVNSLGRNDIGTAYTLTETSETEGSNVYIISSYDEASNTVTTKYYELGIKDGVTRNSRYVNESDQTANETVGHYLNNTYVTSPNSVGAGIFNRSRNSKFSNVIGDFIQNRVGNASSSSNAHGGGLDNHGDIDGVFADFIGNRALSGTSSTHGAALTNIGGANPGGAPSSGKINTVVANFIGNYIQSGGLARGGAYYGRESIVKNMNANFIGNSATSLNSEALGGALNLDNARIENFVGEFISNSSSHKGGAIYTNNSVFNKIDAIFAGNTASEGGAIFNNTNSIIGTSVMIDKLYNEVPDGGTEGTAVGNYMLVDGSYKHIASVSGTIDYTYEQSDDPNEGDKIYDSIPDGGTAGTSSGDYVAVTGGYKHITSVTDNRTYTYELTNKLDSNGNPVISDGITGLFALNEAKTRMTGEGDEAVTSGGNGGAIYNTNGASINAKADFISNKAEANGGAIYNDSKLSDGGRVVIDGNFKNNTAGEKGGAIYNAGDMELLADGHRNVIHGNTASEGQGIYMAGAAETTVQEERTRTIQVETEYDTIPVETTDPTYSHYVEQSNGKYWYNTGDDNSNPTWQTHDEEETYTVDVTIPEVHPTLTFNTPNNGEWAIYDKISGPAGLYDINMTGGGTVSLYNDIEGGNVTLDSTTLNTINNEVHVYDVNDFTVKGDSNMTVDFDIKNERMDRITTADPTNNTANNTGTLNVSKMNFLNDTNKNKASVLFAEPELAHNVLNHGKAEGETHKIETPVRMYDIKYNVHNDDNRGYFEFSSNWNPAILAAPVVLQTGIQSAMNTTIQYAFNHLDTYTKIPKFDRLTLMNNQNRYAFASTDYNENSALRLYNLRENRTSNQGAWLRPYASFESVPLKNGPKVDSITYGTFLGYDSDFHEHKHDWHSVWSTYLGYQGGVVDYKSVSATLNGGVIGLTDTFYKNNFWTAVTLTGGAMFADISTRYGHEDATSLAAALATKTGYNFEFKDGKYILQPIFKASYTFANMLDYRNAAGVKIDAKPLHTIQLNPSLRFIVNCKNGWQPYARVGMVWNLLNETNINAGGYHLPEMHIKPYVEYGLGIQKLYNHRFTGFGQAMVRNGGRNGIAITLGFRYAIGREGDEEFKQMTPWEKFKAFFVK